MDVKDAISQMTAEGRVVFALCAANLVMPSIRSYRQDVGSVLDRAWSIDLTAIGSGEDLYLLLQNYEDEGLFILESEVPEQELPAWFTVTMSVAHVSRYAYLLVHEKMLPTPIDEADEHALFSVVDFFLQAYPEGRPYLQRIATYCLQEIGSSVDLASFRRLAPADALRMVKDYNI